MLQGHRRASSHPYRAAVSEKQSVASFATLPALSCFYWSEFRFSCCNIARFGCDLETCSLVTTAVEFITLNAVWPLTLLLTGSYVWTVWKPTHVVFVVDLCPSFVLELMLQHVQCRGCDFSVPYCYFNAEKESYNVLSGSESWLDAKGRSHTNQVNEMLL
jgi:hypothetical protein